MKIEEYPPLSSDVIKKLVMWVNKSGYHTVLKSLRVEHDKFFDNMVSKDGEWNWEAIERVDQMAKSIDYVRKYLKKVE